MTTRTKTLTITLDKFIKQNNNHSNQPYRHPELYEEILNEVSRILTAKEREASLSRKRDKK